MRATRAQIDSDGPSSEQPWEVVNDLAIYEAWKPFLEPLTDSDARAADRGAALRAIVLQVEPCRSPRFMERVGELKALGFDEARAIELEALPGQLSQHGIVARVLSPVSRVLRRIKGGNPA